MSIEHKINAHPNLPNTIFIDVNDIIQEAVSRLFNDRLSGFDTSVQFVIQDLFNDHRRDDILKHTVCFIETELLRNSDQIEALVENQLKAHNELKDERFGFGRI